MDQLLARQICFMYYEKDMTQREIADRFNLSKMGISRMLQKAKELKIIRTVISLPFELNEEFQKQIKRNYNLKEVIVVKQPPSKVTDVRALLGRVRAFYMGISSLDDCVVGMGVGKTIGHIVNDLVPMRTKNLHIVQLMGGLADVGEQNPFTIVQETCRKLQAQGTYFTSFALVGNERMKDSVHNSSMGYEVRDVWKKCKKALFGVGDIEKGTLLFPKLVSIDELQKIKQLGAIGDILGHCFDKSGNFLDTDFEKRLVSIPIHMLRNIPERIAVAGGEFKAQAVQGLLRSGLITVLVTDEVTARKLL